MSIDARHAPLFDIAFEHVKGKSASERKQRADRLANQILAALSSRSPADALAALEPSIEKAVGRRAAQKLRSAATPAVGKSSDRRPPQNFKEVDIAVLTGSATDAEAREVQDALRDRGADVFFYRDIAPGRRSRKAIDEAITNSDYVVLLVTREALSSNEIDYERDVLHRLEMQDRRERLLVVVVDDLHFTDLPPDLGVVQGLRWRDGGAGLVARSILRRAAEDRRRPRPM